MSASDYTADILWDEFGENVTLKFVVNTKEQGDSCGRKGAEGLMEAFVWEDTPEGHSFWENIHDILTMRGH